MTNQKQIDHYWSGRAPEFSALRMSEYHSVLKDNYKAIFEKYLPQKSTGKILDLGTGAGFFPLILAELGWQVVGIDYSEAMIAQAEKNALNYGYQDILSFIQMDAQNLTFHDESFDYVVSRNVTWTLPDPYLAYKEVYRVLKPGGIFLNFDANYGKVFARHDAQGITPTHPTQTLEQLQERNRLSTSLYICQEERPAWDLNHLKNLGMQECYADSTISDWINKNNQVAFTGISDDPQEKFFMLYGKK